MRNKDVISLALEVDRLTLETRLRDISLLAQSDRSERVGAIATVVSRLPPGAYLLGCGPYNCGVLPLTVDTVVLGRPPSPLEAVPDAVVDYSLNDAVWMVPREASRIHATVLRKTDAGNTAYSIRDEKSTAGTFVNGSKTPVHSDESDAAVPLATGDVISLGPSGVNSYLFIDIA